MSLTALSNSCKQNKLQRKQLGKLNLLPIIWLLEMLQAHFFFSVGKQNYDFGLAKKHSSESCQEQLLPVTFSTARLRNAQFIRH